MISETHKSKEKVIVEDRRPPPRARTLKKFATNRGASELESIVIVVNATDTIARFA